MRNYAFVKNNVVLLVDMLDPEEYINHIREWDAIIDITDSISQPRVGWVLKANILVPTDPDTQQREQQIFGAQLAVELVNKMGSRNILLSSQGQVVNVASLLGALGAIKGLIETGALKTARTSIQAYAPSFPAYSDIMSEAVNKITHFLQTRGWD